MKRGAEEERTTAGQGHATSPPPGAAHRSELLVFFVRQETKCAECGRELFRGSMVTLEKESGALCLACADLDHLDYLPRGDAALTRRATKHSRLKAVVLQWSRTRKQYERQGVLVQAAALARAEAECLDDAEQRERQRERRRARDAELDRDFVRGFAEHIREQYPGCPAEEATPIAEHTCRKYSGRVGRTAAAKEFAPEAIRLAVAAAVRHRHTDYDELLSRGVDRHEARALIATAVEKQLAQWREI
ncbi:MAG: DUF2293 domain-containing protein [Verrucomicrobiaceae bacterium]|nr:DUF2293 domain-containing protein [Verrucomicrobiaceae bacterium]